VVNFLLDTDICVDFLRGRSARLAARMNSHDPVELRVSAVTEAELLHGALNSVHPTDGIAAVSQFTGIFFVIPFDSACARRYAEARVHLEARGTPIGPNDLLIAATALAHDLTLVTHNTKEFSRVLGLRVEDWER
jgi:tRNA(fMet)-specific endonuclease VapC